MGGGVSRRRIVSHPCELDLIRLRAEFVNMMDYVWFELMQTVCVRFVSVVSVLR